jgi:hypothetical protein
MAQILEKMLFFRSILLNLLTLPPLAVRLAGKRPLFSRVALAATLVFAVTT